MDILTLICNHTLNTDPKYLIIGISIILILFELLRYRFYIFSILSLPATFFHESTHFIVSFILKGNPIKFSLIPDPVTGTLGYVLSQNTRWYNAFFIGLAPLLNLLIAYYLFFHLPVNLCSILLLSFLIAGGIPSFTDFKIAFEKGWIFAFGLIFYSIKNIFYQILL